MSKIFFILLITAFLPVVLLAQESPISIGFNANYNFGTQKNSVETFDNTKSEDNGNFVENKKFSMGQSPSIMGSILFSATDYASVIVGIRYGFLANTEFQTENAVGTVTALGTRTLTANRFALIPALQLNTDNEKINLYIRSGLSVNFINQKLIDKIEVTSTTVEEIWQYEGKPTIGFYGGLGVQYNVNKDIKITLGLEFENLAYEPVSASMDEYRKDNVKSNPNYLPIDSEIEFNDWVESENGQSADPQEALQSPIQTFTYNNMGVCFGIIYSL